MALRLKPTLIAHEFLALPIAERVRYVFELSGLTQERFADELGTDRVTVNKWVNGKREPSPHYAAKLEEISTIPAQWFYTSRKSRGATSELRDEVLAMRRLLEERLPVPDRDLLAGLEELRTAVERVEAGLARLAKRLEPPSQASAS